MKGKVRVSSRMSMTGFMKTWVPSCSRVKGTSSGHLLGGSSLFRTAEKCSTTQDCSTSRGSLPRTQSFMRLAE